MHNRVKPLSSINVSVIPQHLIAKTKHGINLVSRGGEMTGGEIPE